MWIAWIFTLVGFANAKHFILETAKSLKTDTINAEAQSNSSSKLGAKGEASTADRGNFATFKI